MASWYDRSHKIYPFLYSEIAGYTISAFLFLNRISPNSQYVQRARLAADWLIRCAQDDRGGFRTRLYLSRRHFDKKYDFQKGRAYTFDTSIAAYGLLLMHRLTKESKYLEAVKRALSFINNHARKKNGHYYPYLDAGQTRCDEDLSKWSDQSGGFHSKLAFLFTNYHTLTADDTFKELTLALIEPIVNSQKENGRFVTTRHFTKIIKITITLEAMFMLKH